MILYNEIKDIPISFCNGCKNPQTYNITLNDALLEIKNCKYLTLIEDLRNTKDIDLQKQKKGQLVAYLFGGSFNKRSKNELSKYSNICVLDFDHIESDIEFAKKEIFNNEYVFAAWISPRGEGIKALIYFEFKNCNINNNIDYIDFHKIAYESFYNSEFFEYPLDQSGKDIGRLCFTSYDEKLLLKKSIIPYEVEINLSVSPKRQKRQNIQKNTPLMEEDVKNIQGKHNNYYRRKMASIYKYLSKHHKSITSSYYDWFKIGQAIANTFSYNIGKNYFLKLCRLDGSKHDEIKSQMLIIQCYKNKLTFTGEYPVNMFTIINAAKMVGYNHLEEERY